MAKYVQEGKVIDVVASADIKLGDVVPLKSCIGVATNDIKSGEVGPVQVVGVWELPKASENLAVGTKVYFDEDAEKITATASKTVESETVYNVPAGFVVKAAVSADANCLVKIG